MNREIWHAALATDPEGKKHPCKARLVRDKESDVAIEIDDRQRRSVDASMVDDAKVWSLRIGPQQFTVNITSVTVIEGRHYLVHGRFGLPPKRKNDNRETTLPKHLR